MKRISLRMRLTCTSVVLMSVLCFILTWMAQYQMETKVAIPIQQVLDSAADTVPATYIQTEAAMTGFEDVYTMRMAQIALDESVQGFNSHMWAIMGGTVLLGALLTYGFSTLALRPVKKLADEIKSLDENALECKLSEYQAHDEVHQLASAFDALFIRLRLAFERERRFTAHAAHELKTPLAVVKATLDVLSIDEQPDPEECQEAFDTIQKQNTRMIQLMDQLFLLTQSRVGKEVESVCVDTLAEEILQELEPRAEQKQLHVTVHLKPARVQAHPVMLKHAISNVVENAIKYNVAGGAIEIDMSCKGDRLLFGVSDTGVGMSEEDRAHIFEAFYRADHSRSRMTGGTGLGLAIVKEILAQYGGTITCEPDHPCGTRFVLTLPLYGTAGE